MRQEILTRNASSQELELERSDKKIILVIDDDEVIPDLISRYTGNRYLVIDSVDPDQIVLMIDKGTVDVCFIDFLFKNKMTGFDFLEMIKKRNAMIPCILTTETNSTRYSFHHLLMEWMKAGGDDVVEKPLPLPAQLNQKLDSILADATLKAVNKRKERDYISRSIVDSLSYTLLDKIAFIQQEVNKDKTCDHLNVYFEEIKEMLKKL